MCLNKLRECIPNLVSNTEGDDVANVCDEEEASANNKGVDLFRHEENVTDQTHDQSGFN